MFTSTLLIVKGLKAVTQTKKHASVTL